MLQLAGQAFPPIARLIQLAGCQIASAKAKMQFGKVVINPRGLEIIGQALLVFTGGFGSDAGGYLGGQFMYYHDFQTPLLLMAVLYTISNVLLWTYFRNAEQPAPQFSPAAAAAGR